MTTAKICIILAIVIYLIVMVAVGVFYSRKGGGSTSGEFYLGGRKLGPIVTAMSAEASDMSSYLLMGLPGLAYFAGVWRLAPTSTGSSPPSACGTTPPTWGPSPSRTSSPGGSGMRSGSSPASRRPSS